MFKSEAEAYQAWRRNLKLRIRKLQQEQGDLMWQAINGEVHPRFKKYKYRPLPTRYPKTKACKIQDEISRLQCDLNRFKVKNV